MTNINFHRDGFIYFHFKSENCAPLLVLVFKKLFYHTYFRNQVIFQMSIRFGQKTENDLNYDRHRGE